LSRRITANNARVSKIRKRDGSIVDFNPEKIRSAIHKAIIATGGENGDVAGKLYVNAVTEVEKRFAGKTPSVENIQDIVEEVLIKAGHTQVAKAYILYRQRRSELRDAKKFFGIRDDLKLTLNAVRVLERRYLLRDELGSIAETPTEMFRRVAAAVASVDSIYRRETKVKELEDEFYRAMMKLEFLPNSPTLMNAGTSVGQLSACFVLPVEDSLRSIFKSLTYMALVQQSGGGTGFSFSRLRPKGDRVKSTGGIASGPLSFMHIYDVTTNVIKQGGRRRGANMGVLRVDHPDILEFITAKAKEGFLTNFNLSVSVTDDFMRRVAEDEKYELVNPRTGKAVKTLRAEDVFNLMATMAWKTGDPGVMFIDEMNRHNQTRKLGEIESTNPCGEQPLLPYESCNLGSVNLAKMVGKGEVNWGRLGETVRLATHFLDNVIDANRFPLKEVEERTKANRKIGLGVMGYAEALIELGMPYNSNEAVGFAEKLMQFISDEARKRSVELALDRGSFPSFEDSVWRERGYKAMRNATLTTIAPTGTISIIAGCSSGIEPMFAVAFVRNVMEETRLLEVNTLFEREARRRGFYSNELMMEIARKGSIQEIAGIPEDVKEIFVTALDVPPEWHIKMQDAFQKHTDNAVSKTVNLPHEATVEDVKKAFKLAYELKCKGVTVYRYGSKKEQVLYIGSILGKETGETIEYVSAESEYAGGCPQPYCPH